MKEEPALQVNNFQRVFVYYFIKEFELNMYITVLLYRKICHFFGYKMVKKKGLSLKVINMKYQITIIFKLLLLDRFLSPDLKPNNQETNLMSLIFFDDCYIHSGVGMQKRIFLVLTA